MYILIRDNLPVGFDIVGAAHASVGVVLKYIDHKDTVDWIENSFRKVICRVNDKEFEQAKSVEDHIIISENTLDDMELAIAFGPRRDWPTNFCCFKLYK